MTVLRRCVEIFSEVCNEVGFRMKEASIGRQKVLGFWWDAGLWSVPSDLEPGMETDLSKLLENSVEAFWRVFGRLMYLNSGILREPLCLYSDSMELLRELARQKRWSGHFPIPPEVSGELRKWWMKVKAASRTVEAERHIPSSVLWSDASSKGMGFAKMEEQRVMKWGSIYPIEWKCPIAVAELLAGVWGSRGGNREWIWAVDNQTAFSIFIKGHSHSKVLDLILRDWIVAGSAPTAAAWVPSECQVADPLSRGELGITLPTTKPMFLLPKWMYLR